MAGGLGLFAAARLTPAGPAAPFKFATLTCRTRGSHPNPPKTKTRLAAGSCFMAGGLGFEPRLEESESSVLPLDDPPNSVEG